MSQDVVKRWAQHLFAASHGSEFLVHRAIRKYGGNVSCRTICIGHRSFISDLEALLISRLNTTNPNFGYNLALGGDTSPMLSPLVQEQVRLRNKMRSKFGRLVDRRRHDGKPQPFADPAIRAKARISRRVSAHTPEVNASRAAKLKRLMRITDGTSNRCILKTQAIPRGWWRGQSRGRCVTSLARKELPL